MSMRRYLYYIIVGLIGLILVFWGPHLVSLFGGYIPEQFIEPLEALSNELGLVLFATAFVTATAGEYSIKRLTQDVETNLTRKADEIEKRLDYRIMHVFDDPVLAEMLRKRILNPDFVRLHQKVTILLERLEGFDDYLKVTTKNEGKIKNVSGEQKAFEINSWIDNVVGKTEERDFPEESGLRSIEWGPQDSPTKLLIEEDKIEEQGLVSFKARTPKINHNETLRTSTVGVQIMRTDDHFIWHIGTITRGLDICIELGSGLTFEHIVIHPRQTHHIDDEVFRKTFNKTENTWEMKIKAVILPFQGFELHWGVNPKLFHTNR
jgi:hypothetical protein